MIQRAVTAIIGVVIGLFATFAVFSAILGGLDNFYLLTQDACNYGSANSPKRVLRVAPENTDHPGDADEIDWTSDGLDVTRSGNGCAVEGASPFNTHLTPTGDTFEAVSQTSASLPVTTFGLPSLRLESGFWVEGDDIWYLTYTEVQVWNIPSGARDTSRGFTFHADNSDNTSVGLTATHVYLTDIVDDKIYVYDRSSGTLDASLTITLDGDNGEPANVMVVGTHAHVVDNRDGTTYAYRLSDRSYDASANLLRDGSGFIGGIHYDGDYTYYLIYDGRGNYQVEIVPGFASVNEARAAGNLIVRPLDSESALYGVGVRDGRYAYFNSAFTDRAAVTDLGRSDSDYTWVEAENVFTAQEQLVTLLAVIAAIGMPIGAMTAIVFFGQAVISSGVSGQGASQVLVAIAAVVVILVAVQMFQQFAGYLGNAFDAVNGDRFVVFDETLGSLAETIAEFWGVLAFAGLINIATIVWRNYSGNFSIGGSQGGL